MVSLKILTFYEYDNIKYQDIKGIEKEKLQGYLLELNKYFKDKLRKNLKKESSNDNPDNEEEIDESKAILEVYSNKVKARHYVGFAAVGNVFVQVLPKVFKPSSNVENEDSTWSSIMAFIRMLNLAYGLKIRDYDLAYLQGRKLRPNLYEVFIYLFAKSLWNEVQRGYYREYVELHSEEKFLRGKLLLSKQVRKLPHQLNTFSVEVHEFIEDNLLNRIFYTSIRMALRKTAWQTNKKLLGELMLVFDGVTPIRLTREHFERVHFTRLNERFRHPFELAKLLFMPPSSGGKEREVSGFFVDMNELFERFILQTLKRSLPEYEVKYQRELNLFSRDKEKKGNIITKKQYPDFIISRNDIPVVVLDAKYRALGIKEGKLQISPDSLRQVYVYAKILENEKNIKGIKTILIFPKSDHYNNFKQELKVGEAMFFDGTQISVLTYNMETLKSELNVDSKFQEKIRELLQNTGNHSNQS
ncbi:restriction endonuclease, partial [Thermococci archaeon]